MKRFITYLYEYRNLKKSDNAGFIKVESQSKTTRMMIVVKRQKIAAKSGNVYLIFDDTVGIMLGEINLEQKEVREVYEFDTDKIKLSGYSIDDVKGVRIETDGTFMASCWTDNMDVVTMHPIKQYKADNEKQKIVDQVDSAVLQMKNQDIIKADEADSEPVKNDIRRIDIADLQKIPAKNWYLVNNSFLTHGYANYKHLVIKTTIDGKEYLGVPGVSEVPERIMAKIFGFNEFEPAAPATAADVESGVFGYWFCPIDLR